MFDFNHTRTAVSRAFCIGLGCFAAVVSQAPTNALAQTAAPTFVAGSMPDRRPESAPRIKRTPTITPERLQQRLRGVETPWPDSVQLIAVESGNWFSPMFRAGMSPPYDLRGWHAERAR